MKRKLFLSLIALMFVGFTSAKAQTTAFNVGIKAGANYTKMPAKLKEISDESGKAGYTIGVFARVGNNVFFQPEVNFTTFSCKYSFSSRSYQPKFRQVTIPLLIGYKLVNLEAINFRVAIGPDLGYTINSPEAPSGFNYKKLQVGGVLNAGIDIGNITLDARYSRGLTTLNKDMDAKANMYSLAVGFKLF